MLFPLINAPKFIYGNLTHLFRHTFKSCTANTTDNVHKVGYIILYKEDTVYLLA